MPPHQAGQVTSLGEENVAEVAPSGVVVVVVDGNRVEAIRGGGGGG